MQMSQWKTKLEHEWPGMQVVGKLADRTGYLLQMECNGIDTQRLGQLQETLLSLGCTGWNWKHQDGCMTVRAYAPQQSRLKLALQGVLAAAGIVTLAASVLYLAYDVRVTEIIGFRRHSQE